MKVLTSLSLALVLAFGAASASAGGKYKHHKKHGKDWHVSVHHNYYGGYKYNKHRRHYRHHRHHYNHRYRHRHHYRHYDYPGRRGGYWRHRRHGYYYPYIGAAIAGSLIGHSFYHLHGTTVCYDDHGHDRRGGRRWVGVRRRASLLVQDGGAHGRRARVWIRGVGGVGPRKGGGGVGAAP